MNSTWFSEQIIAPPLQKNVILYFTGGYKAVGYLHKHPDHYRISLEGGKCTDCYNVPLYWTWLPDDPPNDKIFNR